MYRRMALTIRDFCKMPVADFSVDFLSIFLIFFGYIFIFSLFFSFSKAFLRLS
jgi:hypothetical protein